MRARSWRAARRVLLHPRFFEGFQAYQAGLKFDYARLELMSTPIEQHRFENGRELAAECAAALITVRWRERTSIPASLKRVVVERTLRAVAA